MDGRTLMKFKEGFLVVLVGSWMGGGPRDEVGRAARDACRGDNTTCIASDIATTYHSQLRMPS